jgi:hypothetical protein
MSLSDLTLFIRAKRERHRQPVISVWRWNLLPPTVAKPACGRPVKGKTQSAAPLDPLGEHVHRAWKCCRECRQEILSAKKTFAPMTF